MKLLLDASTALKWVLKEPGTVEALKLREDYRQQIHELLPPDTFVAEVSHARFLWGLPLALTAGFKAASVWKAPPAREPTLEGVTFRGDRDLPSQISAFRSTRKIWRHTRSMRYDQQRSR